MEILQLRNQYKNKSAIISALELSKNENSVTAEVLNQQDEEDEEEIEDESQIWEFDNDEVAAADFFKNTKSLIEDINDPVYDWQRNTEEGQKSRENFTKFLIDAITELEGR